MLANENQEDKENQPAIRESIRTTQIPSTSSSRRTKTNTSSAARKITKLEELQIRLQTSRSQRSLMSSSGSSSSSSSSIPSTASSSFSWRRNSPTTTLTTEQKIQETDPVHDSRLRTNPTLSITKDKENNIDEDDKDVESQKDIESNHQLAPVKILQSSQQNIKNPYECAAKVLSFQHSTQTTFRDLFGSKGEEDDSNDDGDQEVGSCEDDIEQQQQQQQVVEASGEEEEKEEEEEDNATPTFTTTTTTNSIIEPMNHSIGTAATVATGRTTVDDPVRHSGEPSPPPPPAVRPSRKPFCSNEVLIGMCVFCLLLAGVSIGVIAYATYFMST